MKCSNCGGHYKTIELKCPYCETPNFVGKIWQVQRSEAQQDYERVKKETGKRMPAYVLNRLFNRMIVVGIVLFILFFIGSMIAFLFSDFFVNVSFRLSKDKIEQQMETDYQNGDYDSLYRCLSKYQLFSAEEDTYYMYCQAALMAQSFDDFLDNQYYFLELLKTDKSEEIKKEYLVDLLEDAVDTYYWRAGNYRELAKENEGLRQEEQFYIEAFVKGTLKVSEEEWETMIQEEYVTSSQMEALADELVKRGALE